MSPPSQFHFVAPVQSLAGSAQFVQHCVVVPAEVATAAAAAGSRRLHGTLNGAPFNLALHNERGGIEKFLLLGRDTLRAARAEVGTLLTVACEIDLTPHEVLLPEELLEVLNQEPEAAARFYALTPGRQRSLAHYVTSAKHIDTRINRALDLAHKLRTHTLYGDRKPT